MTSLRLFHLAILVLLAAYGVLAAHSFSVGPIIYWVFWLIYVGLYLGARRKLKWCLKFSVVPPLLVFLLTAPTVVYNFWAFISGHPLYQDAPGSIIIVGILALCLTLPSALVLGAYWINRREVFSGA